VSWDWELLEALQKLEAGLQKLEARSWSWKQLVVKLRTLRKLEMAQAESHSVEAELRENSRGRRELNV